MKKSIQYLILSLTLIILFTGCSSGSRIICSSKADSNGMKIEQKYILYYSKDLITKVDINKSYAFDSKEKFESFGTVIDFTISNMKEIENKYIKFNSRKTNKKYTTKLTADMKKVKDDELSKLGLNKKLKELKAQLEEQGLTCK